MDRTPRKIRAPAKPILKYYAFEATRRASFTVPIFILFYTSRGLSLAEVGVLEAHWTIVVLIFETPTGYLGDRIGRKWSLIVGTLLSATGAIAFVFADSFAIFAGLALVRGIAHTFKSGTQEAWLYDTLKERTDTEQFAHHTGRAGAIAILAHGGVALIGGALYSVNHALPWVLGGVVVASGALVILSIREPEVTARDDKKKILGLKSALALSYKALSNPSVGILTVYTALLFALLNTLSIYVQPVSTTILKIEPAQLGFVYAGFAVTSAGIASQSGWIRTHIGTRQWYVFAPPLVAILLGAVVFYPSLALLAFVLARGVRSASHPLFAQYVNDRIESEGRATFLSVASTIRSLATAPLNVLGGVLTGIVALPTALSLLGAILLIGSLSALSIWHVAEPR